MKTVRFFDPGLAYRNIQAEILPTINSVLAKGDLILRDDVAEFEKNFAKFVGTDYAVSVASGTDALFLSLKALGISKGDEVILPAYTFRATAEAVYHAGGTPVLADLNEDWRKYQNRNTKFIIPAHIAGEVLDWELDEDEDLFMIEDACQAVGAAPIIGETACYSFYPAKILGCYGDGGAIATNDPDLYEWLKKARNHFKDDWAPFGWNSRLDNVQAAVLNIKLKKLPAQILRRKQVAMMYDEGLTGVGLPIKRDVYQDYIITHPKRDELYDFLKVRGVETMKNGYPFPAGLTKGPATREYESTSLRIPCNAELTDDEVKYVIEQINDFTK